MRDKHYHNYYREYRGEVTSEEVSAAFMVKKGILETYERLNKAFNSYIKRAGNTRFTNKLLDKRIPKVYKAAAREPVDEKKIVFVEIRHPNITNSFEVMFDELVNNYDYNIHSHFLLNSNTLRADYAKRVLNAVEDIATAKYVFLNEGSNAISAIPMRPETKVIQLWHGCGAFKRFGFSTADLIFGASRKEQLKHPFNKNYSLVTVSSPEVVWAYKEAMNLPEESEIVQPTGSSRTDIFFNDEYKEKAYEHVYNLIPQAKGKKIILYAPTFRGRVARATTPDRLNIEMFHKELGDDYVLLFKHHPVVKVRPVIEERFRDFAFDVTDTLSIEDLIITSDFCISDYSSLVFEYSIFEKPLIFFAYDLDSYFDWRGFYYDYNELAPGPVCKTNFEMIDYIRNIDTRFDKKAVQDFRYKFMRSCDGNATKRIIETMFDNLEEHRKPCEKFEHYYDVPKVQSSSMPYHRMVRLIREEKEVAREIYASAVKAPIEKGSIVAFDIQSGEVKNVIKNAHNSRITIVRTGDSFDEAIKRIATANYILIDQVNPLIDSLDIREETKVVLMPPEPFPLKAFGKNTKEYRSGLKREQYELAPLYKSVDAVVCPSETTAEIYKNAVGNDVETIVVGDVKSDIFFNHELKKELLDRLYETCPQLKGKRIIAYFQKDFDENFDDATVYEYLSREYAFLKYYDNINVQFADEDKLALNYTQDSIVDVSLLFSKYELMIISDIIIGGFESFIYSAMVTGRPVIIYSKEAAADLLKTESFIDIEENSPTPVCSDLNSVISIIRNIYKYDFTKYNELKATYMEKCDGKSFKHLAEALD